MKTAMKFLFVTVTAAILMMAGTGCKKEKGPEPAAAAAPAPQTNYIKTVLKLSFIEDTNTPVPYSITSLSIKVFKADGALDTTIAVVPYTTTAIPFSGNPCTSTATLYPVTITSYVPDIPDGNCKVQIFDGTLLVYDGKLYSTGYGKESSTHCSSTWCVNTLDLLIIF